MKLNSVEILIPQKCSPEDFYKQDKPTNKTGTAHENT
jgi:hypothetical protein